MNISHVTHEYYAGTRGVDPQAMHKEARYRVLEGLISIVHDHAFGQACVETCVIYKP